MILLAITNIILVIMLLIVYKRLGEVLYAQDDNLSLSCDLGNALRAVAETVTRAEENTAKLLEQKPTYGDSGKKALEAIERMNSGIANILNYDGFSTKDGE